MTNSFLNQIFGANNSQISNSVIIQKPIEPEVITVEAEVIPENPFLWEVEERPIFNQYGEQINGYKSIIRNDTKDILHVCKNSYTPTSNEVLYTTALQLCDISGLQVECVKEHQNGAVVAVWLKSQTPDIIGGHSYNTFMIVGNSHNSNHHFFIGSYSSMMRCNNQFANVHHDLRASHTRTNLEQIKNIIRFYATYEAMKGDIKSFLERIERKPMNPQQLYKASLQLFQLDPNDNKRSRRFEDFKTSLAAETAELGNNGLGFFQAVTHYTSHVNRAKDRVYSNIFGTNADLINRAINYLKA